MREAAKLRPAVSLRAPSAKADLRFGDPLIPSGTKRGAIGANIAKLPELLGK